MTKGKKRIISNIIFGIVIVFLYTIVAIGIIGKFNGNVFRFGSLQADVILTNSMSYRNEEHKDFLEGTNQIQPFDLVFSHSINENTELNLKDIVLFRSPNYHYQVVCHRIVGIEEKGSKFSISNCHKMTDQSFGKDYIALDFQGFIKLDPIPFQKITIELYTKEVRDSYLLCQVNKQTVELNVETEKINDNLYHHTISYTKDNNYTYGSIFGRVTNFEHYITSITYESKKKGNAVVDTSSLVLEGEDNNQYNGLLYSYKEYEIRADTALSSDGTFKREELISKVSSIVPKIGHIINFLQSIPGIIMIVGLAIIVTVASYLMNKTPKKKDEKAVYDNEHVEPRDNFTKEENKENN